MISALKSTIARQKIRVFIGLAFAGLATSIVNYLTFAKVWSDTFTYYGVPIVAVYIGLPVLFVAGIWALGFLYERSGLYADEISHLNKEINPEFTNQCRQVTEIHEDMKKIKEFLGVDE